MRAAEHLILLGGMSPLFRAVPGEVPALPLTLLSVLPGYGRGAAVTNYTAARACEVANAALYANSNSYAGVVDQTTFDAFLQTRSESYADFSADTTIRLNNSAGLRNTQTSQTAGQRVKHFRANNCTVTIAPLFSGTDLPGLTWTLDAGGFDVYLTTVSQSLQRVMRTDQSDRWGFAKQLRKYSSLAALQAAGSGWYLTGTTLYVKLGAGVNVDTVKSVLSAKWLDAAISDARILVQSSIMVFEAIGSGKFVFDGMRFDLSDAVAGRQPQLWVHGGEVRYPNTKGITAPTSGGKVVLTNSVVFSSTADGLNLQGPGPYTGQALMLHANCLFRDCGAIDTIGDDGTLQGVSAHGGVDHVGWGSTFEYCNSPGVADTVATGTISASWLVACGSNYDVSTQSWGFVFGSGSGGSRTVYLDTDQARFGETTGLVVSTGATVYTYQCDFVSVSGGTSPYDPSNPYSPALKFSDPRNSGYLPILM